MGKYYSGFAYPNTEDFYRRNKAISDHSSYQMPQTSPQTPLNTALKYSGSKKREKSIETFQNNRIETCSYVKKIGNQIVAMPFYSRSPKVMTEYYPQKQLTTTNLNSEKIQLSTSQTSFNNKQKISAGMRLKPLEQYNPDSQRNRLEGDDYKQYYPNRSNIMIGDRMTQDKKQYYTTAYNEYGRPGRAETHQHPGIAKYKFQWDHKQRDK